MTHLHRMLALLPLAALVACESSTAPQAAPSYSRSALAPVHLVSGGGRLDVSQFSLPPEQYGFTASKDANGLVRGQLQADFSAPDVTFHMVFTCLSVRGNVAWLGGTVTKTHDATMMPVGISLVFSVQDNGQGSGAGPDRMSFWFARPAADCNLQLGFIDPVLLWLDGDIKVR